jgi:cell wall-associated NlpC family hydrolase
MRRYWIVTTMFARSQTRCLCLMLTGSVVLALAVATGASAAPLVKQPVKILTFSKDPNSLSGLAAQARAVEARIAKINDQVEIAVEAYNVARWQLDQINIELADARAQLARTQAALSYQQAILGGRVTDVYKSGSYSVVDALLSSGNVVDVEAQVEFLRRLSVQDQLTTDRVGQLVANVTVLEQSIEKRRQQALTLAQGAEEKRLAVEDKLAQLQAVSAGIDAHIQAILDRQRRVATADSTRLAQLARMSLEHAQGSPAQIAAVREAMRYLGVDYVWGGASPSGFDCSGLVMYVFADFGVDLPHFAAWQAQDGLPVALGGLQPGDLLFWGAPIHHVGIYIADGLFIEAPHTGDVVKVSSLAGRETPSAAGRYPLTLP